LTGATATTVSPTTDYQWWYGQPALDGDLLRIKAAATRIARRAGVAEATPPSPASVTGDQQQGAASQ